MLQAVWRLHDAVRVGRWGLDFGAAWLLQASLVLAECQVCEAEGSGLGDWQCVDCDVRNGVGRAVCELLQF